VRQPLFYFVSFSYAPDRGNPFLQYSQYSKNRFGEPINFKIPLKTINFAKNSLDKTPPPLYNLTTFLNHNSGKMGKLPN